MGKILSNETAARLMRLLNGSGDQPIPPRRGGATSRIPVLVRCTSATAAGGAEVGGDQCYPAVVVNTNSLLDDQEDGAEVWLTLLDTGTSGVAVPTSGKVYYGLFAGNFDPDPEGTPDPRPRVFATVGAAGGGSLQVEDVDESPSVSDVTQLRFDSADGFSVSSPGAGIARVDFTPTLTVTGSDAYNGSGYSVTSDDNMQATGTSISLPSAGTYLVWVTCETLIKISAGSNYGYMNGEIINTTDSTTVPLTGSEFVIGAAQGTTFADYCTTTFQCIYTVAGAKTIELYAARPSGPTWTTSQVTWARIGYVKIG